MFYKNFLLAMKWLLNMLNKAKSPLMDNSDSSISEEYLYILLESQPKEIDDNKERYPSPCDTIEKIKKGEVDNPSTSSQTSISTPAKKRKIKDSDKIPLQKKLALAIGAAPLALPLVTATVFITLFLLDVVLLEPKYSSLVLLLGRSFDAVSDPLVGFLVNKTQRKGNLQ